MKLMHVIFAPIFFIIYNKQKTEWKIHSAFWYT